jgi:hypothetical protein
MGDCGIVGLALTKQLTIMERAVAIIPGYEEPRSLQLMEA